MLRARPACLRAMAVALVCRPLARPTPCPLLGLALLRSRLSSPKRWQARSNNVLVPHSTLRRGVAYAFPIRTAAEAMMPERPSQESAATPDGSEQSKRVLVISRRGPPPRPFGWEIPTVMARSPARWRRSGRAMKPSPMGSGSWMSCRPAAAEHRTRTSSSCPSARREHHGLLDLEIHQRRSPTAR